MYVSRDAVSGRFRRPKVLGWAFLLWARLVCRIPDLPGQPPIDPAIWEEQTGVGDPQLIRWLQNLIAKIEMEPSIDIPVEAVSLIRVAQVSLSTPEIGRLEFEIDPSLYPEPSTDLSWGENCDWDSLSPRSSYFIARYHREEGKDIVSFDIRLHRPGSGSVLAILEKFVEYEDTGIEPTW